MKLSITSIAIVVSTSIVVAQTDLDQRTSEGLHKTGFVFAVPQNGGEDCVPNSYYDLDTASENTRQEALVMARGRVGLVESPEKALDLIERMSELLTWFVDIYEPPVRYGDFSKTKDIVIVIPSEQKQQEKVREARQLIESAQSYLGGRL